MKKLKILSLGLAALLGICVISVAMVTSTQRDDCLEVNAASITDSLNPVTTLNTTSSGRFSWNRTMTGTTTKVWTSGAVYCSFANNATFTATWTVPDGYQVIKVRPFYNILTTTDWKDTYRLESTVTCGSESISRNDTIAHYPVLRLTESGRTPQHANVSFTIKNVSGYTGNLAFDTGEIFEIEYELMTATVTLDKQSGDGGTNSFNVTYGKNMPNKVTVPIRTNYRFEGYYDAPVSGGKKYINADGTSAATWDKSVTSATLYARWTLLQFDVTLNQVGGTGGTEHVQAILGQEMPSAIMPTRTGYTFNGYYDATSGGTKYYNADGSSANNYDKESSTTLYANWNANKYKASFNPGVGTGGLTQLDVTYDSNLPDLTAEQIPSLAASGGHSYSFGGYFTEQPTPNGDGSYTPHGKQYYDKDGKGLEAWHEASDTTLYAYYTIDMEVSSFGYSGIWDGENHGISVNVNFPEGTTVYYGDSATTCNNPDASDFLKSDVGTYDIYYEVRLAGYTPFPGHETITIAKNESVIDPLPTAKSGLEFTNNDQELINAGTVNYGSMLYAVNTTGVLPEESEFSETVPTGHDVDKYYVFYMSSGDANHNPYPLSSDNVIEVEIAEVDKAILGALIADVNTYLDEISIDYPDIAETLANVKDNVKVNVYDNLNVTATQVNDAIETLKEALSKAKARVVEEKIKDIGQVSYTEESKELIDIASNYLKDKLSEEDKAYIDTDLLATLESDIELYNHVDEVVKHIEALDPENSKAYVDAVNESDALYDGLTEEEKAILPQNYVKDLDDNMKILPVMEKINDIGPVAYSEQSKDLIDTTREAYEALSQDQKELIKEVNYDILTHDEEVYDNVDNVYHKINDIGEVELSEESKNKIDKARHDYDLLTEEEKALVDNNTYQNLDDHEHVYKALDLISRIGDIEYSDESSELIKEARSYYDSLSEAQKAQVGKTHLQKLEAAEVSYAKLSKSRTTMSIIFLIISILLLIAGCYVMYRLLKKKDDKSVKVRSVSIFTPVILASLYIQGTFLVLYIILGLTALVWLADLCIYLYKKNHKNNEAKETINEDSSKKEDSEEEVKTITDEKGNIFQIRYIKSFTAKLIQSPEETKKYYEELKNEVLSYKNTHSRVSWHYDAVNAGREYVLKFVIRGKTLCVYFPLDADKLEDKYKVEKVESKRFEDVPCMYRIKNDRRLGYAKELIAVVASNLGLVKGEEQHEVYSDLPYEPNKPLIERGLIKEQKVQINKPGEVVIDTKVDEEGDEIVTTVDNVGQQYEIRYLKSFTAKLSQTDDEIKDFYNELKNYALSFKGSSNRVSWHYDSINVGRKPALKFVMKRKNLAIYYALDTSKIGQKYKVEKVEYKKYEDVPCMYLITNERRKELSKALIDRVMRHYKCEKGKEAKDEYRVPFESKEALLKKGLIREVRTRK